MGFKCGSFYGIPAKFLLGKIGKSVKTNGFNESKAGTNARTPISKRKQNHKNKPFYGKPCLPAKISIFLALIVQNR